MKLKIKPFSSLQLSPSSFAERKLLVVGRLLEKGMPVSECIRQKCLAPCPNSNISMTKKLQIRNDSDLSHVFVEIIFGAAQDLMTTLSTIQKFVSLG